MRCGYCKQEHATKAEVQACFEKGKGEVTATNVQPATDKQVAFLNNLLDKRPAYRSVMNLHADVVARMTKQAASAEISHILEQVPAEVQAQPKASNGNGNNLPDVPAGHYAVPSRTGNNDLDFWRVDRPTDGKWSGYTFVKRVVGGKADIRVKGTEARQALEAIVQAGVEAAGIKYGQEIGRCYRCNRHLTDEVSRQLGIGPDCRQMV